MENDLRIIKTILEKKFSSENKIEPSVYLIE
jgi:hypothetical protein